MIDVGLAAAGYSAAATAIHVLSTALAIRRCRHSDDTVFPSTDMPPVTIVRPVCGLDTYDALTLASTFDLDYPAYEMVFCAASPDDPAIPLVRALMARYPSKEASLLIGNDLGSPNPKLNNIAKGWLAARHDWIVLADSNVLMPRDYIQRLFTGWRNDTGLVCAPPIGSHPDSLWAEIECAFLNTYQARWQYATDSVGYGFAQGKTMLWRKADLDAAGGIPALSAEIAEDAAATKLVRAAGLKVRLVDQPFPQPLGERTAAAVWSRQLRWAQLRRQSFPFQFAAEILTGCLTPVAAGALAAEWLDMPAAAVAAVLLAVWLGCEASLAYAARWHLNWRSPLVWLCRDLLLPVVWVGACLKQTYAWRGNRVHMDRPVPGDAR